MAGLISTLEHQSSGRSYIKNTGMLSEGHFAPQHQELMIHGCVVECQNVRFGSLADVSSRMKERSLYRGKRTFCAAAEIVSFVPIANALRSTIAAFSQAYIPGSAAVMEAPNHDLRNPSLVPGFAVE
jgi:hypothetical protein